MVRSTLRLRRFTGPAARRRALRGAVCGAVTLGAHVAAGCSGVTLPNVPLATAGGQQLWADVAWDGGWRVQRHAWTGHARVLDTKDVRRAWGDEGACVQELAARRAAGEIEGESTGPVVVLLHGLWRTRDSLSALGETLAEDGYEVVDLAYPSTQGTIEEHAAQVAGVLDGLPGEGREVSFVTHSLGGLVTRALLAREGDPWRERHLLGRAVFIAAPHGGSRLAEVGGRIPGVLCIYGKPSRQIAGGAAADLPVPPLPFMDIAGGDGCGGWNPLVPGDDDGVVAVAEARLEGEERFLRVRALHTFIAGHEDVLEATAAFLTPR